MKPNPTQIRIEEMRKKEKKKTRKWYKENPTCICGKPIIKGADFGGHPDHKVPTPTSPCLGCKTKDCQCFCMCRLTWSEKQIKPVGFTAFCSHCQPTEKHLCKGISCECIEQIGEQNEKPKLFKLIRINDESGISGTGHVLDGVVWPKGKVTVCWNTKEAPSSVCVYDSMKDFIDIHLKPHPTNKSIIEWYE